MNITEVKDLMTSFDGSSLREFSWENAADKLSFSKNEAYVAAVPIATAVSSPEVSSSPLTEAISSENNSVSADKAVSNEIVEGEAVTSPLVGVAYLKPAPDKDAFIHVGDTVKKGQTLLIIEAMKVMNEIPAPADGTVTAILVAADDVVEFGQELVRIK